MNPLSWLGRIVGVGRAAEQAVDTAERVSEIVDTWSPSDADGQIAKRAIIAVAMAVASHKSAIVAVGVGWLYWVLGTLCLLSAAGTWALEWVAFFKGLAPHPTVEIDATYTVALAALIFGAEARNHFNARKPAK